MPLPYRSPSSNLALCCWRFIPLTVCLKPRSSNEAMANSESYEDRERQRCFTREKSTERNSVPRPASESYLERPVHENKSRSIMMANILLAKATGQLVNVLADEKLRELSPLHKPTFLAFFFTLPFIVINAPSWWKLWGNTKKVIYLVIKPQGNIMPI